MGVHKQRYAARAGTVVRVEEVHGNLTVHGWDRDEVEAVGCAPADMTAGSDEIALSSAEHCRLRLPHGAELAIERVHGRVVIEEFEGTVRAEKVGASVTADGARAITLETVSGDVAVHSISGDVVVEAIGGSFRGDSILGDVRLEGVGGNLVASQVGGDISASVGGSAVVRLEGDSEALIALNAGGNIRVDLGEATPAELQLSSGAGSVRLVGPDGAEHVREPHWNHSVGAVGRRLHLAAGGRITLRYGVSGEDGHADPMLGEGLAAMAEEYAAQVEARFEGFAENFTAHIDDVVNRLPWMLDRAGMGSEEAERIARKVAAAGERALHRAEHRAARALRHAERRQARGEAALRRSTGDGPGGGGGHRAAVATPVEQTDSERELVLRLLASGRVNAGEADELLAALGTSR